MAASGSRKLIIEILGNAKDAAKAFGDVRSDSAKTEENLSRFGTTALGVGVAIAAGLTYAVTQFVEADVASQKLDNSARNAAAGAKINAAALRDAAQAVQAKTAADGDALVAGQAMLVQFGATQDQTLSLTPLLADLSRKMGVDTETAARAVGKALNGSTGQLSKMGIQIDATKAQTDPFLAVFEALTTTVGGFAEAEGATAAGTLARIKNQLGDIVEAVGGGALEAFAPLIDVVSGITANGGAAGDALGNIAGKLGVITATTGLAMGGLIKARDGITSIKDASFGAAGGLGRMGFALGGLGAVGVGLALVGIVQSINEATKSTEDFQAALIEFEGAATFTEQVAALNKAVESTTGAADDFYDAVVSEMGFGMQTLEVQFGNTTFQIDGLGRALKGMQDDGKTALLAANVKLIEENAYGSTEAMDALRAMLAPFKQDIDNAANSTRGHSDAMREDAESVVIATEALDEYADAVKAQTDPIFGAMRAINQTTEAKKRAATAQEKVTFLEKAGLAGTEDYANAQRELADANLNSTTAAVGQQTALATLAARMKDGTISGDQFKASLDQMVRSGSISKTTADQMAFSFGLTAGKAGEVAGQVTGAKTAADRLNGTQAKVGVSANTGDAEAKIEAVARAIRNLRALASSTGGGLSLAISFARGQRSAGGPVHAGQPYLVGERGPEIVVPGSGYVVPTRRLIDAPTGGGGGGSNLVVNVSAGVGDPVAIGRTVVESIKAYERTSGNAWRN